MSDIFFSYANEDRDRIEPLVRILENAGCSVWWDLHIGVGEQFDEVIENEIDAAQCVIVVWSKHSVGSRWVKTEAAEGNRRRILVPVRLDEVSLPLEFRRIETADLVGWQGDAGDPEIRNLLNSVDGKLQKKLEPVPAGPEEPPAGPSRNLKRIASAISVSVFVAVSAYLLYQGLGQSGGGGGITPRPAKVDLPQVAPVVRSTGTACITPGSTYDLDEGRWKPERRDSDIVFNNEDGVVRSLKAWSGAAFHNLGNRDFDSLTFEALRGLAFDLRSLDATIGVPHDLKPGTVFAVRTSDGRYAKVQILQYGAHMKFNWVTYGSGDEGQSVAEITSAPCTREEQLHCGTGKLPGDGFSNFTVPVASSEELRPEISYSYNQDHGTVYMGAHLLDENDDALNRGFRPTLAPISGKQQTTITISRPGRSKWLFVWLYEQNKAEAFACERYRYERNWGG